MRVGDACCDRGSPHRYPGVVCLSVRVVRGLDRRALPVLWPREHQTQPERTRAQWILPASWRPTPVCVAASGSPTRPGGCQTASCWLQVRVVMGCTSKRSAQGAGQRGRECERPGRRRARRRAKQARLSRLPWQTRGEPRAPCAETGLSEPHAAVTRSSDLGPKPGGTCEPATAHQGLGPSGC